MEKKEKEMEKKNKNAILENFKTIFQRHLSTLTTTSASSSSSSDPCDSPKPIPFLSPLANSVVSRSSMILKQSTESLQDLYEQGRIIEPDNKESVFYARGLLELCSYKALNVMCSTRNYLSDKEFRHLTYDMMLAWESPSCVQSPEPISTQPKESPTKLDVESDEGWPLFYSNSTHMALQVDNKKTVGLEAFARIAPACALIADTVTVNNLFDALTASSGHRLHFLIYDKYLQSLDKVIKSAKSALGASSNLQLVDGEIILDVDGTVPTQPVLQHIGISAWPGRLTLSNYFLHFESLGVGQYDKAARYDLYTDLKQVIKPELTGPLGARLFDKAVMYRSLSLDEPVYLEFPEFKGSSRRDYWLDIILEILRAHRFTRSYNLKGVQISEAVARAILGIFRTRAIRETFHFFSSQYKTLLTYNLAENLPGGDTILEALSISLSNLKTNHVQSDKSGSANDEQNPATCPVSFLSLIRLGLVHSKDIEFDEKAIYPSGYIHAGEGDPLEVAVKQSKLDTGKAEAAQETVNQVKVDGIDANLAVMKELLSPVILVGSKIQHLASWEEPLKSTVFLVLICYMFVSGWIRFVLPLVLVLCGGMMLWRRYARKGKPVDAFRITAPPKRNAVEQLITLQEAISHVEAQVQSANIALLKMRAILFAVIPQTTYRVAILLLLVAAMLILVPLKYIMVFVLMEAYTREMPLRRDSSYRWLRRLREWWFRIPAAPVQLLKSENTKKKN